MSRRLLILVAVALLFAVALGDMSLAQSGKEPAADAVRLTAAAGGRYHLDGGPWQIRGAAGAPGYHLAVMAVPAGGGTPCCCSYLPCVTRRRP